MCAISDLKAKLSFVQLLLSAPCIGYIPKRVRQIYFPKTYVDLCANLIFHSVYCGQLLLLLS